MDYIVLVQRVYFNMLMFAANYIQCIHFKFVYQIIMTCMYMMYICTCTVYHMAESELLYIQLK